MTNKGRADFWEVVPMYLILSEDRTFAGLFAAKAPLTIGLFCKYIYMYTYSEKQFYEE